MSGVATPAAAVPLRRTLGTLDLVLAHVLVVVGLNWSGAAAKAGGAGLALWIGGLLLFHLPLAAVVAELSRRMPEEGGLARWAEAAFGARAGFLTGWSSWSFLLIYNSTIGILLATSLAYLLTGSAAAAERPAVLLAASAVGVLLLCGLALAGLSISRWLHALSATGLLLAVGASLAALLGGDAAGGVPPRLAAPELDFATLVLFTRITVYGLAGLECLAFVAGEARDPGRALPRSLAFAVPLVALAYLSTTALVVRTTPAGEIDLVQPLGQVAARLADAGLWPRAAAALFLVALLLRELGLASQAFTAGTRLPLVGGWSGKLPARLGTVDRRGVPVAAILLSGGVALALGLLAALLYARQAAFQWILSIAGLLFGASYVVLFLIPLLARRFPGGPFGAGVRGAALSGLVVTVAYLALAVVPILDVERPLRFAAAAAAGALALLATGWAIERRTTR